MTRKLCLVVALLGLTAGTFANGVSPVPPTPHNPAPRPFTCTLWQIVTGNCHQ